MARRTTQLKPAAAKPASTELVNAGSASSMRATAGRLSERTLDEPFNAPCKAPAYQFQSNRLRRSERMIPCDSLLPSIHADHTAESDQNAWLGRGITLSIRLRGISASSGIRLRPDPANKCIAPGSIPSPGSQSFHCNTGIRHCPGIHTRQQCLPNIVLIISWRELICLGAAGCPGVAPKE